MLFQQSDGSGASNSKDSYGQAPCSNMERGTTIPKAGNSQSQLIKNEDNGIREVWDYNLEEEFLILRQIVQKFPYVAMDTEFPGIVARPLGEFESYSEYQYQKLRVNVDILTLIQVGFTFFDENGQTPKSSCSTWQFNFKFKLSQDMYARDSIQLLQTSGIQFKKHEERGIKHLDFAELLMTSGIVLMDEVKWITFHSGYDFGYLLKLLTDQRLPATKSDFFETLKLYFPTIYDVKYLMQSCADLKGGLQEVSTRLDIKRKGIAHQAGSDSILTGLTFFKIKKMFFGGEIDDSKFSGQIFGLNAASLETNENGSDNSCVSYSSGKS